MFVVFCLTGCSNLKILHVLGKAAWIACTVGRGITQPFRTIYQHYKLLIPNVKLNITYFHRTVLFGCPR